jgi:hypothetical protein
MKAHLVVEDDEGVNRTTQQHAARVGIFQKRQDGLAVSIKALLRLS